MTTSDIMRQVWDLNMRKVQSIINKTTAENAAFRLTPDTGTVGFYLRHIGEVMLSLSKLTFGTDNPVQTQTMRVKFDDGRVFDLEETKAIIEKGNATICEVMNKLSDADWDKTIATKWGERTPMQTIVGLINHNAHHVGQIELTILKGKNL
jgi:uncharacterized damage-inducible protein DinB